MLDAIEAMEGYHADKASQKEQWLTVSRYSASDGAAPIPGAQVHVEYKGQTFPVHADEHGMFPHLPHPPAGQSPTKVKVLQPNGLWKTLVELAHGTPPTTGVLVLDMLVMTAQTLGRTAPKGAKDNKIPVHYRVQPGDSLQSIATKFRSTTADIQTLNHLSEFSVHPEQMLWIHGKGFEVDRAKAKAADKAQLGYRQSSFRFVQEANNLFFGKSFLHVQSPVYGIGLQS